MHHEFVGTLAQRRSRDLVGYEHVVGLSDELAVEVDAGKGVEALKEQRLGAVDPLIVKLQAVPRVIAFKLLHFENIEPEKGIFDEALIEKCELEVAGHLRVDHRQA